MSTSNPYAAKSESEAPKRSVAPENVEGSVTVSTESVESIPKSPTNADVQVPEGNVEEVLAWVGGIVDRAQAAIEHESAQPKPRKSLINKLKEVGK